MKAKLILTSVASIAIAFATSPAALADNSGAHFCISGHTSACMDVKDTIYQNGQPVWVYNGGNGLGFSASYGGFIPHKYVCDGESSCGSIYWPFNDHTLDAEYHYDGDIVFNISAPKGGPYCLSGFGGNVGLSTNCGVPNDWWVADGPLATSTWINVGFTNSSLEAEALTAEGRADKSVINLLPPGDAGAYQTWDYTCGC